MRSEATPHDESANDCDGTSVSECSSMNKIHKSTQ